MRALVVGTVPADAVPNLIKLLESKDEPSYTRNDAAVALGNAGPAAADAVPLLIEACRDDTEPEVRETAIWALGRIGPAAKPAVPELIRALKDESTSIRRDAARSLGQIGSPGDGVVAALAEAVGDADNGVGEAAVTARREMGPAAKSAVPVLVQWRLVEEDDHLAGGISRLLRELDPRAEVLTPAMLTVLKTEEDPERREEAVWMLIEAGPPAAASARPTATASAVPTLIQIAQHDVSPSVRNAALGALGSADRDGKLSVPVLIKALHSEDKATRGIAARALGHIGRFSPAAKAAVPDLIEALRDDEWSVRDNAASALGQIRAKEAIPALTRGIEDGTLKPSARRALRRINDQ